MDNDFDILGLFLCSLGDSVARLARPLVEPPEVVPAEEELVPVALLDIS